MEETRIEQDRVEVREYARAVEIILQPGDMTRYIVAISQTFPQAFRGELTIALVDMGKTGAAFTYSAHVIESAWEEMKEKPMHEQILDSNVGVLESFLPEKIQNPWTARAIIEAAAFFLEEC